MSADLCLFTRIEKGRTIVFVCAFFVVVVLFVSFLFIYFSDSLKLFRKPPLENKRERKGSERKVLDIILI